MGEGLALFMPSLNLTNLIGETLALIFSRISAQIRQNSLF